MSFTHSTVRGGEEAGGRRFISTPEKKSETILETINRFPDSTTHLVKLEEGGCGHITPRKPFSASRTHALHRRNRRTHEMSGTDDEIIVNVRLLPEETPMHAHLTRFQRGKRGEVTGPTLRLKCKPSDTVATLKKMILSTPSLHPVHPSLPHPNNVPGACFHPARALCRRRLPPPRAPAAQALRLRARLDYFFRGILRILFFFDGTVVGTSTVRRD